MPDTPFSFVGRNIRVLRKQKKWTQAQLGQKLQRRKLSRQAIAWIESGKNTDLETIGDIARTLGVDFATVTRHNAISSDVPTVRPPSASQDAAAVALVDHLLATPQSSWSSDLTRDRSYHSAPVVERLVEMSENLLESDPPRALAIARLATEGGGFLDVADSDLAKKARAAAWRQCSFMLFYTGDLREALAAVDRADEALSGASHADYELARIAVCRSVIYSYMERTGEAIALARRAEQIFRQVGDNLRVAMSLHAEAYALMLAYRYREALPILIEVENDYRRYLKPTYEATLNANIGFCCWNTGRRVEALQRYEVAAAMHAEYGAVAESARLRQHVAEFLAGEGQLEPAKERLRGVRTDFERLGMHNEVINASMGLAEILLAEKAYPEATALCAESIDYYQRSGMAHATNALAALSYLQEAAAAQTATPEEARRVRSHFQREPDQPTFLTVSNPESDSLA